MTLDRSRQSFPDARAAVWSPDGATLAIFMDRSIVIARPDGSKPVEHRVVFDAPRFFVNEVPFAWSPDSQYLAVSTTEGVVILDPRTGDTDTIAAIGYPVWAPNSRRVAVLTKDQLLFAERDGSQTIPLAAYGPLAQIHGWSFDSNWFAATRDGTSQMDVIDAFGGVVATLGLTESFCVAAWSPNANTLAFNDDARGGQPGLGLWSPERLASVPVPVNPGDESAVKDVRWSHDGLYVTYHTLNSPDVSGVLNAATEETVAHFPGWTFWNSDGSRLAIAGPWDELGTADPDGGNRTSVASNVRGSAWLVEPDYLAFFTDDGLFVSRYDGTESTRILGLEDSTLVYLDVGSRP